LEPGPGTDYKSLITTDQNVQMIHATHADHSYRVSDVNIIKK